MSSHADQMVSGSFPGERIFVFPDGQGLFVLAPRALPILGRATGHPSFVLQSLHEQRRSLHFDVRIMCAGVERLAVVHHYIYIYITFRFHLHAHVVVEKMCFTIPCRGITSR